MRYSEIDDDSVNNLPCVWSDSPITAKKRYILCVKVIESLKRHEIIDVAHLSPNLRQDYCTVVFRVAPPGPWYPL
jgi:hypothetical protein